MDFYKIKEQRTKDGTIEIYPDFTICRSTDLMVRGRLFYAIWNEHANLWSTDEYDVQYLIDKELWEYRNKIKENKSFIKTMSDFSSGSWTAFKKYVTMITDNASPLDKKITFKNTAVRKEDHVSKRLTYDMGEGSTEAYEELISTLYDPEERAKIEWSIGAIISGDAKELHKFLVLYGKAGTGKSTIINIIQQLFEGYYTTFDAKALGSNNNAFATETFKNNPLIGIQHDGDLSKIEDNTLINSIVAHEYISVNEKYKSTYTTRFNCFLILGTNRPVKITDAKSGIIRRLIDVEPSGRKLSPKVYQTRMQQISFELGAIAHHCLQTYRTMGKYYYTGYRPIRMMYQTDVFFNFIDNYSLDFYNQEFVTLTQAYQLYKEYCQEALIEVKLPKYKFREEMKNYFETFYEKYWDGNKQIRSCYVGFDINLANINQNEEDTPNALTFESDVSAIDEKYGMCRAQYTNEEGTPLYKWDKCKTFLQELDKTKLHYVRLPEKHIVIDFDLKDETGEKSLELNIEAASKWPSTYAELSKSGKGVHLHYIYEDDVSLLENIYEGNKDIEIKTFRGHASLRRKFTKSNGLNIELIKDGLPTKGVKMINSEAVKSEKSLRELIKRNLRKEIHSSTKPSVDFIHTILEESYNSGMSYDVTDMRQTIFTFANKSTNQSRYCCDLVSKMKFKSDDIVEVTTQPDESRIVFYDVECFKNLFVIVWKFRGEANKVYMINPKPHEVEALFNLKLVGFNNRSYDNHMIYARSLGYNNEQCYKLSQRIINGSDSGKFGQAYNISYTDIYDFSSAVNKKSLKKWEIELGIHHMELGLPWDQDVPEELWPKVAEYCGTDVDATEAVFEHLQGDWAARQILAKLSGLSVNHTTNNHTIKIVFGDDKNPQEHFNIPDLSKEFPGYKFEFGKSTYRGMEVGEGGLVVAYPHCYGLAGLLDVAAMHPSTIEAINMFGKYTKRFSDIKNARVLIKHGDIEEAGRVLDGALKEFLNDPSIFKDLSNALKTVVNSAYGLTFAKFDNPFKHKDNYDNVVAKRGALFMVDLFYALKDKGWDVFHIKTDSVKIADITQEKVDFVMEFGKKYGYTFEWEHTYDKICLVNNAVYIAKDAETNEWTATGAQFKHPIVFKSLFSKEDISFKDYQEIKAVKSAMYLDFNENLSEGDHDYRFIGKTGSFVPILSGNNAGMLLAKKSDEKYDAVTGTKGYRWMETEYVEASKKEHLIDHSYYHNLVAKAKDAISSYCDFDWFVGQSPYEYINNGIMPF